MKKIVVTGLGAITPVGNSVKETWENCLSGNSGVVDMLELTGDEEYDKTLTHIGAPVKNFNPSEYIKNRKSVKRMEKFSQFAVAATREAILQSGIYDDEKGTLIVSPDRICVSVGNGIGGLEGIYKTSNQFGDDKYKRIDPLLVPRIIANMATFWVSKEFGITGPTFTPTAACASGAQGVIQGANSILLGDTDIAVVGGTESTLFPYGLATFDRLTALNSSDNDNPIRASRPFTSDRAGFVMGEGAGIMVIESEDSARKRGAKILCELVGWGTNADANDMVAPMACGTGASACMDAALKKANLQPSSIGFINAHGTSTPAGDIAETKAIKKTFGKHAYDLVVNSTKSVTGHCIGAAGGIEAVITAVSLAEQIATPTINLDNPDPECDLNYSANKPTKLDTKYGMTNSFGFGGVNTSLIFKV